MTIGEIIGLIFIIAMIVFLIVFCFTGNLELLKICGIFSIASYVSQMKIGSDDK